MRYLLIILLLGSAFAQVSVKGVRVKGPKVTGSTGAGTDFPVGVTALASTFVDPSPPTDTGGTSLDGGGGISFVVKAWGTGLWRSRTGALAVFGGGHNDYYGNQIYQYTITDATTQVLTRNSPTIPSMLKCSGYCSSTLPVNYPTCTSGGTSAIATAPNSDHQYNTTGYIAGSSSSDDGLFKLVVNFPGCPTPAGSKHAWKYVFSTDTWTDLGVPTLAGSMGDGGSYTNAMAIVRVDDTHYYYWAVNSSVLSIGEYNPATNTSTRKANDVAANTMVASVGAYDPVHDTVIHVIDYGSKVVEKYDRAGVSNTTTALDASCPTGTAAMGFAYDPASGKILIFPNSSVNVPTGNTFYLMDTTALTCSSWTAPGDSIPTANHFGGDSNGTFGRLQCGVTINGQPNLCVLLNDYNQKVFVVRTQ
jgi:hypothetical protein